MTPAEFADKMRALFPERYDDELAHIQADDLMCDLLISLGYSEGVTIFQDASKWYA